MRVATFNAYLLSPFFKCFNPNFADCLLQINGETEKWANHLADTILADPDRFDIIVINEAWDEDAKSILVRRLRPLFPNFVRKIDADLIQVRGQSLEDILTGQPQAVVDAIFGGAPIGKINGEDSGLMLFANAKFRFVPLPNDDFKWGSGSGQSLEGSTDEVAFTLFEACGSADCFSAKGAALVRLDYLPDRADLQRGLHPHAGRLSGGRRVLRRRARRRSSARSRSWSAPPSTRWKAASSASGSS